MPLKFCSWLPFIRQPKEYTQTLPYSSLPSVSSEPSGNNWTLSMHRVHTTTNMSKHTPWLGGKSDWERSVRLLCFLNWRVCICSATVEYCYFTKMGLAASSCFGSKMRMRENPNPRGGQWGHGFVKGSVSHPPLQKQTKLKSVLDPSYPVICDMQLSIYK